MSHFYAKIQGTRGEATRTGTKASGIRSDTAGWNGAIQVEVFVGKDGKDRFIVWLTPWQDSGGKPRKLAEGILDAKAPDLYHHVGDPTVRVGDVYAEITEGR